MTRSKSPATGATGTTPSGDPQPAEAHLTPGQRPAPADPKETPAAGNDPAAAEAAGASVTLELRKKELIEQAVERSGVKKRDAKPVIEAMLALLGEAISAERPLNLEPMGKLRVTRIKDNPNGRVHVCKLRRKRIQPEKPDTAEKTASDPLAEADRSG
ncbi:HU family DNA-binding protein [Epibacterium sp. MM17-32]|uniref:HU family DNA-binding protein n=1 Tax=Epibacterium sp. MM17-32 TaxID=2917734 RepID=UPI001EF6458C|nr:HU family DNA-binding protein [Epibacterium sp. MM17-32]MCG7629390.1 HU family DNA-binding protein [Epibacterium sp. MM17-32]